jgi:uncharacterized protein YkwD
VIRLLILSLMLLWSSHVAKSQPDTLAAQFIDLVAELRANPASFIDKIDSYVLEWRSFVQNKSELKKAASEVKKMLASLKPLPAFRVDSGLTAAACEHATDCQLMGVVGHIGSDGSNPLQRATRHGSYTDVSEVITYGQPTAQEMLAAFLVDHDSPDRGHRKAILSTTLTLIGVCVAPHPSYRIQIVVDLATSAP